MLLKEIGKYEIIRHLGSGYFGDVYQAHDHALDDIKAIKVLNIPEPDKFMEQLEEARLLHKCKFKHIVKVNEADIYIVDNKAKVIIDMEYLEKGSFENLIKNNQASIHDTIKYVIHCLFALEHTHNQGILHRDIKPANIMLSDSGAKLSDFGLATALGTGQVGSPKGYTTHLPPEYFKKGFTSVRTDIFAMGITLFRACNYISDWNAAFFNVPLLENKIKTGKLISAIGFKPFIPKKIKTIIKKACAPSEIKRYQSAYEMRNVLQKIKLLTDWRYAAGHKWTGISLSSGNKYTVEIIEVRNGFNFEVKRNNRRVKDKCILFLDFDQAFNHLNNYIATTLCD